MKKVFILVYGPIVVGKAQEASQSHVIPTQDAKRMNRKLGEAINLQSLLPVAFFPLQS